MTTTPRNIPRWVIPVAVLVGILLIIVLPLIGSYNGMVNKDEAVTQSFADLDAQLQRRNDLLPNLVSAVEAAQVQEREVFGEIARARQNYAGARSDDAKLEAAGEVSSAISRLLVVIENYPQLRSNENVRDLQTQLEGTENRIAQSRRDYNGVVTDYNRTIRRFPRSVLAGLFGFDRRPVFEAGATSRDAPRIEFNTSTTAPSTTAPGATTAPTFAPATTTTVAR